MPEPLRQYGALLQDRNYRLLFVGQALSQLGDWMNRVALLVLAYRLTGSALAVALIQLATLLPRVIVSPFGGVLVDRHPKRALMIALDLLRAILATSLIPADRSGQLWFAGAALLLLHSLASVFNPARGAILPAIIPRAQLGPANASTTSPGNRPSSSAQRSAARSSRRRGSTRSSCSTARPSSPRRSCSR